MLSRRSVSSKTAFKRKQILKNLLLAVVILSFCALLPVVYLRLKERGGNGRGELQALFESGAFEQVYAQSVQMLAEYPLDFFLLTIQGFSAYQLAIAQINNFDTLRYVDSSIWALRRALLLKEGLSDGRVYYVLGKAYFHKGAEYADLAINYLEKAKTAGFTAPDVPEYLGLAYAVLEDYHSSVAAFSLALTEQNGKPSDILLLAIARSYIGLGEADAAKAYLVHSIEVSRDSRTKAAARLLLGDILINSGDLSGAEAEFTRLIEESGESAEARYQLGVIYAALGDTTRARAEWRRAIRLDPAHEPTRRRLN